MVEVKTADLIGNDLEWSVACAMGLDVRSVSGIPVDNFCVALHYSTDWSRGGPLIEEYKVCLVEMDGEWFAAFAPGEMLSEWSDLGDGPTALVAACRAIVRSKLGETVSVPAELVRG